jgi:hypothetical protein
MSECPDCQAKGRPVAALTIVSHVVPSRLAQIESHDGWALCSSSQCEVVYFRDAQTVARADVLALPFHKGSDRDRLVCFCFGHTAAAIVADLQTHQRSLIRDAIKSACQAGLDDCRRKNPQGRCCLADVARVLAEPPDRGPCCG